MSFDLFIVVNFCGSYSGCATFIFCFLHFSLFTVHFAVAFSPSAAYLRQGYSGVPDANQAKGCLRWGERRQSCALCRSATSDSAICRTRGFLFQQFSACEVPDRACSMGCTAAFPASVGVLCSGLPTPSVPCVPCRPRGVLCSGLPTPSVPCDRLTERVVSCARGFQPRVSRATALPSAWCPVRAISMSPFPQIRRKITQKKRHPPKTDVIMK